MPPKASKAQNAQKKAEQKVKQKVVEDKTFGLKNKNKSKNVQKMVQTMQASVVSQNKRKTGPTPSELRKDRKAEEEARKEELRKLFATVDDKKKKKEDEEDADDPYAVLKQGEEDYLWTAEDFEPVELEEGRLEEQLERELEQLRERLAAEGGGTRVNEDSFQRWKEQKRREKEEEDKKKRTRALRTGQMTGRMLYEHNQSIFVDDDEGVEEYERQEEEPEGASGAIDSSLFDGEDLPEGEDGEEDGEEGEEEGEEEA